MRVVPVQKQRPGPRPRTPDDEAAKAAQLRRDMVRRLLEALDKRLSLLEKRMAPDAELGEAMHKRR